MKRRAARLAWFLWALSFALTALYVALLVLSWGGPGPLTVEEDIAIVPAYLLMFIIFSTVGAVIASGRPENSIGWLFCGASIAMAGGFSSQLYAQYALLGRSDALAGGAAALWLSSWLGILGLFVVPTFLLFLFPDGRAASSRWRVVVRLSIGIVVLGVVGLMFKPGPIEPFEQLANPLGVGGPLGRVFTALNAMLDVTAGPFFLTGGAAIVSRLRRAGGESRLQLKWFAYAASVMGSCFGLSFVTGAAGLAGPADIFFIAGAVALGRHPCRVGPGDLEIQALRIDRVINRTLVYGALTAVLGAVYFGVVVTLQAALGERIGASPLVVAGTTLGVAALFRPARSRIQDVIDRRFNRRRYDAQQTVEAFSARLRDEIDLDELTSDLLITVRRALQPAHASVWFKPSHGAVPR